MNKKSITKSITKSISHIGGTGIQRSARGIFRGIFSKTQPKTQPNQNELNIIRKFNETCPVSFYSCKSSILASDNNTTKFNKLIEIYNSIIDKVGLDIKYKLTKPDKTKELIRYIKYVYYSYKEYIYSKDAQKLNSIKNKIELLSSTTNIIQKTSNGTVSENNYKQFSNMKTTPKNTIVVSANEKMNELINQIDNLREEYLKKKDSTYLIKLNNLIIKFLIIRDKNFKVSINILNEKKNKLIDRINNKEIIKKIIKNYRLYKLYKNTNSNEFITKLNGLLINK
jgi:hypothetical protein